MSALMQSSMPLQLVPVPSAPLLLEDYINGMFQSSESPQLRELFCQTSGSQVVLRGFVSSNEVKQQAHDLVRSACGMREIANEILVLEHRE